MSNFAKLKETVASVEKDVEKFYTGNNAAAGTRVRKALQEIKGLAQEIRKEITEKKNAGK
jgi:hypothetical protein